ncbi:MAG: TonB-dependent receptor [Cyclobacteriaceae bacterium]|nr:TonB-dependent receptor [Cyclobacteriaceae bacterium]
MKRLLLSIFVALFFAVGSVLAQDRTVSGRVTSTEDGSALPGVNVVLKGTTIGTATDSDGRYSLSIPSSGGSLVFSFIGLQTQEIPIGDRNTVDISLALDATQLSEVVVVGYGVQEKRKLTTSISSVGGNEIAQLATPSFVDQLAGRAAGVQIQVNSGIIGTTPTIRIRGVNSLTQGSFPLVVIDGIPMTTGNQGAAADTNPLADINPADIESYEVLKDGAAAAIYGSRAANGVILITTKRGSKTKGRPTLDFTATTGWLEAVNRFDLLNAREFEQVANLKLANAGQAASAFTDTSVPGSGETDWQDVLLRKGRFSNYNINLGGASETTNYYFSVGYQFQESNIVNNHYERFTFRTNVDHKVNKWFEIGTGINLTRGGNSGLNTGTNALSGNLAGGLRAFPNVTVMNPSHSTGYNLTGDNQALGQGANTRAITSSWTNQAFVLDHNRFEESTNRILANIYGQVNIADGLSFKTYYGVDWLGNKSLLVYSPVHGDGRGANGRVHNTFRQVTLWNWQNTVNYNKDFGDHGIDVVGGIEYQLQTFESFSGNGTDFSDVFFMQHTLISQTYGTQLSSGTYNQAAFASYFGRINYSFKDKYLLGFSARNDGISRLHADVRYGTFFGGSVGYRLSEEDFYKNSGLASTINDIKVRGSYAQVGNVDIGLFPYASLYGSALYGSQNGIAFSQAGNPDLLWETSKKLNIGADFGFLNNKIGFTVDYFVNDIDGNILGVPYPPSLGIPGNSIQQNIGVLRNSGVEFSANATVLNKSGFTWNVNANFTTVKNEVIETFRNTAGDWEQIGVGNYSITARVGQPRSVIYGYEYVGVNPANGFPMYRKGNGTIIQRNVATASNYYVYNPADPADISTAASLSTLDIADGGDRQILGQTLPKWYGGLTNTFNYKNLSLEIFMRFAGGNHVYNQTKQDVLLNQDFTNSGRDLLRSWTPENPNTDIPKMYILSNAQVNQSGLATSRFVEKGDFLRIQNIVLGYSVPKEVLNSIADSKISRVRVFAQVQNAFTFTGYTGLDPELGGGFDNNTNPMNRTFTFGINVGL